MSAISHFIKKGVRQAEIDEYLGSELGRAGYGGVEIAKTPLGERLIIHAARPGIVIGRRGKNIRMITEELVNRFGLDNPQIEVKEVKNPELNAKVMAYSLVSAIERGVHRRRAAYSVLRRVTNAGAKGCEIIIAGKLTSKRSRREAYRMGLVAKSGELQMEYVHSANAIAVMKLGTIGVTVNIMKGDVILPDELSILNVKLDEPEVTIEEEEKKEDLKKPEKKPTPKKEEEQKDKKAEKKKTPAKKKEEKKVTKKKTDLDEEVEKLSDLIEKTPGEEVKPKKPVKKPTKKKEPAKKTEKKPAKKTTKKETKKKPTKKKEETKKKAEPKKKKAAPKKSKAKPKPELKVDTSGSEIEITYNNRTYSFDKNITLTDIKSLRGVPVVVKKRAAKERGFKSY